MSELTNLKKKKLHIYTIILQISVAFFGLVLFNLISSSRLRLPIELMIGIQFLLLIILHWVVW